MKLELKILLKIVTGYFRDGVKRNWSYKKDGVKRRKLACSKKGKRRELKSYEIPNLLFSLLYFCFMSKQYMKSLDLIRLICMKKKLKRWNYLASFTFLAMIVPTTNHMHFSRNVGKSRSRLSYWSRNLGWFTNERLLTARLPKQVALVVRSFKSPSSKKRRGYWY